MYFAKTVTLLTKAMQAVFNDDYPVVDMRNLYFSPEYPTDRQYIPAVWVDFDPIGPLRGVGIGHIEDVYDSDTGQFERTTRWSFAGNVTYTIVALSSLERMRIFDQIVSVIAFGEHDDRRSAFRQMIENDDLIQLSVNFGEIDQRGFSAAPGTPWGTSDVMYEATVAMNVIGEFVSAPTATGFVPISGWHLYAWADGIEEDPTEDTEGGPWLS